MSKNTGWETWLDEANRTASDLAEEESPAGNGSQSPKITGYAPRTRSRVSSRIKAGIVIGCLAACIGVGGTLAYLTATDSTTNQFTVVQALKVAIEEPGWDDLPDSDGDGIPDDAEEMVPNQTVTKDPRVKNTAGTQAWLYLRVDIPTYTVRTVVDDGSVMNPSELQELYTYEVNSGWVEIEGPETGYKSATNMTTHYYAYTTPVDKDGVTGALFNSVKLINLADGQLDSIANGNNEIELQIDLTAYGIQTYGFTDYNDAWSAYNLQVKEGSYNGVNP